MCVRFGVGTRFNGRVVRRGRRTDWGVESSFGHIKLPPGLHSHSPNERVCVCRFLRLGTPFVCVLEGKPKKEHRHGFWGSESPTNILPVGSPTTSNPPFCHLWFLVVGARTKRQKHRAKGNQGKFDNWRRICSNTKPKNTTGTGTPLNRFLSSLQCSFRFNDNPRFPSIS